MKIRIYNIRCFNL